MTGEGSMFDKNLSRKSQPKEKENDIDKNQEYVNDRIRTVRMHFCNGKNKDFAEKLNVSHNQSSNLMKNGNSVGRGMLIKIAETFGINIEWLLTGEGNMIANNNIDISDANKSNYGNNNVIGSNNIFHQNDAETLKKVLEQKEVVLLTKENLIGKLRNQLDDVKSNMLINYQRKINFIMLSFEKKITLLRKRINL